MFTIVVSDQICPFFVLNVLLEVKHFFPFILHNYKNHFSYGKILQKLKVMNQLKVYFCIFIWKLMKILSLERSTFETRENNSFSSQKFFSFLRYSYFRILEALILRCYQMPKQETKNKFNWITWKVNTDWWWNLARLYNSIKENV